MNIYYYTKICDDYIAIKACVYTDNNIARRIVNSANLSEST